MITINLLRHTLTNEHRQRRRCQIEASVVMLTLVGAITICGLVWVALDRSLGFLQKQKEQKTLQLVELERIHGQLKVINQQKAELMSRSHQATYLEVQQRRSIRLLDTVSRSLNPLQLWLASLELEKDQVMLMGFAESKAQIVEFVQNLKSEKFFQDVAVLEAGKTSEESSVYHFKMSLLLTSGIDNVTSS